jgi:hypothetical protein
LHRQRFKRRTIMVQLYLALRGCWNLKDADWIGGTSRANQVLEADF